jgi:murein DD-endopeptidase MepM/ murein hydrolase activator NlpD
MQAEREGQAWGKKRAYEALGRFKNYFRSRSNALAPAGKALLILCSCVLLFSVGIYLGLRAGLENKLTGNIPPVEHRGQNQISQGNEAVPGAAAKMEPESQPGEETSSSNRPPEEACAPTAVMPIDAEPQETLETQDSREEAFWISAFSRIIKPVSGEIIRRPGWFYSEEFEEWQFYPGVDIATAAGAEVKAVVSGVIKGIYRDETLGEIIVIGHGSRYETCYARVSWSGLIPGQEVSKGETIARAAGEVVHFQLLDGSDAVDPVPCFQEDN